MYEAGEPYTPTARGGGVVSAGKSLSLTWREGGMGKPMAESYEDFCECQCRALLISSASSCCRSIWKRMGARKGSK